MSLHRKKMVKTWKNNAKELEHIETNCRFPSDLFFVINGTR